ncbi:DUF441 domain-containing protein [Aneurinibacillus aneurinilyticus]|nr:DUF441 domain-containing protein [Aneurinibacillus aneurinilyticus]MED0704578.1 DUF441 domain-containing protein [Aneurinibacillus aneurinilyticus]MED0725211.1 DUF441 domain-containing protein [Aneurinibacillus aneurinilyticus]MED0735060.1 DUF441 domain-containing protein [Aneurinibacillus aneurinilyticus]MED0742477.1 DUF441 domain-containing protein [Aneurinibacillus aneurinilyticus]
MDIFAILAVIAVLGIISKNAAIWIAAGGLMLLKLLPFEQPLNWVNQYGLKIGIAVLTMGVLAPIALGKITTVNLLDTLKSGIGIMAIVVGLGVAYLGGRGTSLLTAQPHIVTGLLIGTILGVAFFRGVPVGPLIAAGVLALFADTLK